MQIHLFRSAERLFGATLAESGANLPAGLAPWTPFKTLDVTRDGAPVPGLNVPECLDDIERFGFYISEAHFGVTEKYATGSV